MDFAMVLEARLLPEGLAAGVAHIRLLPRVDVLVMAQGFPRSEALGAVAAGEGLEL